MDWTRRSMVMAGAATLAAGPVQAQQQVSDPDFKPKVDMPAIAGKHLTIDQAHNNFHTRDGRYAPFARLMTADGWTVGTNDAAFSAATLAENDVLVVANALPPKGGEEAFTTEECTNVEQWVKGGGSLWLIADHAPFGKAAQIMAKAFGFDMGTGYVFEPEANSQLVFTGAALGDHLIMHGRNDKERIRKIKSFTGQSLSVPKGATALLKFGDRAREAPTPQDMTRGRKMPAVAGRCQSFALDYGAGRLVVMGEAAMLSAQVVIQPNGERIYAGMNVPGYDDQQFALNVGRWLERVL
ncbi:hypothetical protein [Asticcacaulis benevestitus]|uniref:DUF4350 domain-containing protein n=1 Tax=Asticcacaulis benevestitus DSM 16100 = ATCC BAA-896 TaxID=1121022 RepID=V4RRX0_9CAUL|nr:hypothetical protein [Asticcacaulis benevestitus]ESQ93943.1 hypothetical protein ABENE_04440 [Asticcacaulis benevestitus DSM 16100 = ATCC BAA-896]